MSTIEIMINSRQVIKNCPPAEKAILKKALTVTNPLWITLGMIGRPRRHIPPKICLLKTKGPYSVIPRGFDVSEIFGKARIKYLDTTTKNFVDYRGSINLRPYQQACLDRVLKHSQGYIVAPTGSGKSVIGCELIARRSARSLIIVHTRELLRQWKENIRKFLNVEAGIIGDGKKEHGDQITIAMVQTLSRDQKIELCHYGLVLVDEMHHTPASTWTNVIERIPAYYRYGLSATPERRDNMHIVLPFYFGSELYRIEKETVIGSGGMVPAKVQATFTRCWPLKEDWVSMISELSQDQNRNVKIVDHAIKAAKRCPTLVLTDRVAHAETLCNILKNRVSDTVLLHGKLNSKKRNEAIEKINAGARLTIATTGIVGEGLDVACWQALILALPMSGKGSRLTQAIGRIVRPAPGKTMAWVLDIVDEHPLCLNAFKSRKRQYKKQSISVMEI